ncbi:MAG: ATP-dependent RNA helicase HrpA, partial [Gammaproteobacteria bacterium]|nr:ATP-dependent RNA helicase HrpA [Gammaproteobacteria bacterium]
MTDSTVKAAIAIHDAEISVAALAKAIPNSLSKDQHRFRQTLQSIKKQQDQTKQQQLMQQLSAKIAMSMQLRAQRLAAMPTIDYPAELPVVGKKDDIKAAIAKHQVVIIAGETGSGKTTQIPKICLELGRGVAGMIGHTQPRRLAAHSVSARLAAQLKCPVG